MTLVLWALFLFCIGFSLHWALWRIARPRATARALIVLLVATTLLSALALYLVGQALPGLQPWLPQTWGAWMQCVLLALAGSAVYVMTYPAIEVESPTLVLADRIAKAGPEGLERESLHKQYGDGFLVIPRIRDLERESLVLLADGRYRLTPPGRRLAAVFRLWRRLLGAPKGG